MVWFEVRWIIFFVFSFDNYFELNWILVLVGLRILNICCLYVFVLCNIFLCVKGGCVVFFFVGFFIILVKLLIKNVMLWFKFWKVWSLLRIIVWFRWIFGVVGFVFNLICSGWFFLSLVMSFFLGISFLILCLILVKVVLIFVIFVYFYRFGKNMIVGYIIWIVMYFEIS